MVVFMLVSSFSLKPLLKLYVNLMTGWTNQQNCYELVFHDKAEI
jgi:hypothetical protein